MSIAERIARAEQRRLQAMQKGVQMSPSTSEDRRVESWQALVQRDGRTAPGSEIALTGQEGVGGMESGSRLNREMPDSIDFICISDF